LNIKFVEIYNSGAGTGRHTYSLRTVYVNPSHVVCLREDPDTSRLLEEGRLTGLDERQSFTKISVNRGTYGQDLTVVGPIDEVYRKLDFDKRQLLKG
jgi:predicted RNA methylase